MNKPNLALKGKEIRFQIREEDMTSTSELDVDMSFLANK